MTVTQGNTVVNWTIAQGATLAGLNAEAAAREAADTTLQTNIDAEATSRQAADIVLQNNIDSESTERQSADTSLQSLISSETSSRQSADTNLDNNKLEKTSFDTYAEMRAGTPVKDTWIFVAADEKNGNGDSTAYFHHSTSNKRLFIVAIEDTEDLI